MISVKECEKLIRPKLSDARFYHSQCVSKEAAKLAKQYGADVNKAEIAGILHDICKETPIEEQLKIIERFGIMMQETEKKTHKLYHAISGAAYVKHIIGIEDGDIIEAIRWHTSGKKNMSLLEKVVFVADFNSADRDYPGVEEMRRLAKISLEDAMLYGFAFTIAELTKKGVLLDLNTAEAYNDIVLCLNERKERV
ncbi:bis(5'-nucleosyl)-tetraphosphatase (symmetrical) YqeK [Scatolibacter rhodanostii]|uniref:bis(5'-nucleosyl)-tetraphosphatase (symmetrical) YqeK n=1 Tax=Scatolibacter rhodanostii TaxID=2014781 RepID=UPI001FA8B285|nr:bis(5'-nucleosyl)-tetraphosphatase (symmetrical) YqeK [Scatolibacter rhodanostii]